MVRLSRAPLIAVNQDACVDVYACANWTELESTTEDPQPGDPSLLRVLIATKHRRFNHCEQQDAEEMLQVIMSLVQEDASRISSISSMRSILDTPPTASPTSSLSSLSCSIGSDEGLDLEPRLCSLARVPSAQSMPTAGAALASVQVPHGMLSPLPFQGWMASHLTCSRCEKSRPINHQPFIDLSLPLPNTQSAPVMGSRFGSRQVPGLNSYLEPQAEKDVRDLLKQYVQSEDIDNVECARCTAEHYTNWCVRRVRTVKFFRCPFSTVRSHVSLLCFMRMLQLDGGVGEVHEPNKQPHGVSCRRFIHTRSSASKGRSAATAGRARGRVAPSAGGRRRCQRLRPSQHPAQQEGDSRKGVPSDEVEPHAARAVHPPVQACRLPGHRSHDQDGPTYQLPDHGTTSRLQASTRGYSSHAVGLFVLTFWMRQLDINEIFGQGGELEQPGGLPFKRRNSFAKRPPRSNVGEYTLQAVIVHQGTADSGHYVTYRMANNRWYFISDTNVREAPEREVLGSQAYMLFYVSKLA